MSQNTIKDINYALVEEKRPPIYTSMKYWGKKPHNIWNEYISNYTKKDGVYLDPFSGSAMSAFESFVAGKKAIALDLNPLTSFIIETICTPFDKLKFINSANAVINNIESNVIYTKLYKYKSDYPDYFIQNVKWENGKIYEVCIESMDRKDRQCLTPSNDDYTAVEFSFQNSVIKLLPKRKFRLSESFSKSFLEKIGDDFSCLYTKRNLWVLSELFCNIIDLNDEVVKKQLLFAFIQTVHLSTKMCVPRSKGSNRDYSTSWGRSAFIYSKKQMEMNPLLLFKNCCFEKQSVLKCLNFAKKYFKRTPIISDITKNEFSLDKDVDIWYGKVNIKNIDTILPEKSVDFILTDPPYGGLIQYLDLSTVWLSWLELYDGKYAPNYEDEITVNGAKDFQCFEKDLTDALQKLNKVLSDTGKMVLTFNNKDLKVWSSLLKSIENSGFRIEKVIHQQNKRTSESNVSDPYGMSASDFYIRCIKSSEKYLVNYEKEEIEELFLQKTIEIINERKEPTPYQILFNGLLSKLSISNIDISSFEQNIQIFLKSHLGKELVIYKDATTKAGSYWWINNMKYNQTSSKTLTNKVRKFIEKLFDKVETISEVDLFKSLFKEFPNGLTPDIEDAYKIIKEYAYKRASTWVKR